VKIFFTTDIHGSERCFRKFLNAAKAYRVEALVLGGDITGKMVVPLVEEPDGRVTADVFGQIREARGPSEVDELESAIRQAGSYTVRLSRQEKDAIDSSPAEIDDLFKHAIIETTTRWMELAKERLEPLGVPIYVSAGNDDEFYVEDVLAQADYVCWPEDQIVELPDGREMVSIGYSNVTPFDSPRELPDDELQHRMEKVTEGLKDPERAVFNFHCPPHSTNLDVAPLLDSTLKPVYEGGTMVVAPAGSLATRALIEQYQPLLSLHGHIHESRASQKIGRTLSLNPGSEYSEGVLRGCLVELKGNKIRGWQFTSG
jgi:Icc-related predicted phosphoesterase